MSVQDLFSLYNSQTRQKGYWRELPQNKIEDIVDFTSNDYLGIAQDRQFQQNFLAKYQNAQGCFPSMSSSASRLLMGEPEEHRIFEKILMKAYGKEALIFNSGYHANTGIISSLVKVAKNPLIIADKLVHASIIDGMILSKAPFARFRHNDLNHLRKILQKDAVEHDLVLVVTETVFSMDGDSPDIEALVDFKKEFPQVMLYLDEAHGVGVCGPRGLGLAKGSQRFEEIDIVIGTLGKALASTGAYAIVNETMKNFLVNNARSLIFSTTLSPMNMAWSVQTFLRSMEMDTEREYLQILAQTLAEEIGFKGTPSHIQYHIVGDPIKAMEISHHLKERGFNVLPIRYPTVPKGTDRLRISLSAHHTLEHIKTLAQAIKEVEG